MSSFEMLVALVTLGTFILLAFSAYIIGSGIDEILTILRSEEAGRIRRANDE